MLAMSEKLRSAIEAIQHYPANVQDEIATQILAELEEREWDRLLATPESDAFLDMLEEEALRDHREGRTEEGGFGRD